MKKLILSAFLATLSFSAMAQTNSSYSAAHALKIKYAVRDACSTNGRTFFDLDLVKKDYVRVDNGIVDEIFTTKVTINEVIDQQMVDQRLATVVSEVTAGYDHEAREWGMVSITSVTCH